MTKTTQTASDVPIFAMMVIKKKGFQGGHSPSYGRSGGLRDSLNN
jgi:hypothetical protein